MFVRLLQMKRKQNNVQIQRLIKVISVYYYTKVIDLRDKIFGFFDIISNDVYEKIEVNYFKNVRSVYQKFVSTVLKTDDFLLLNYVEMT